MYVGFYHHLRQLVDEYNKDQDVVHWQDNVEYPTPLNAHQHARHYGLSIRKAKGVML